MYFDETGHLGAGKRGWIPIEDAFCFLGSQVTFYIKWWVCNVSTVNEPLLCTFFSM